MPNNLHHTYEGGGYVGASYAVTASEYVLTQDLTEHEFGWLDRDFIAGEIVYRYSGHTYGCISPEGIAVTLDPTGRGGPFFEVPRKALLLVVRNRV